jgi:endonuclease/exonuclease/phosphatase family metal-dependent hydrolase
MKNLNFFDKIIFFINSLAALLLVLAYILPYIPPKTFSILSVLSLGVPLLIFINILFFLFWLLRLKRQLILSLFVLLIGFNYITSIYKFTGSKTIEDPNNFSVMNYNVRVFNFFEWLPSTTIESDILNFVKVENPSILCLQEYHKSNTFQLEGYTKYEQISKGKVKSGQAIFSKFPIINSGSIAFPNTNNNAIFVDVLKQKDTIRVYSVHLQSSKLSADVVKLNKNSSKNLTRIIGNAFKMQQLQAELVIAHKNKSNYRTVISGDFNNTAYSYVYNQLKGGSQDAFEVAGTGFGETFKINYLPLRIDFILVDERFTVNGFENYNVKLSDHYPIKAILK